jgi:hypothetical protein
MFSMFTKFPTAVLGDMVEIMNRDGVTAGSMEVARKYAAPVILLAAIDKALFGGEERTGVAELTLGKTAPLSNLAPGTAVTQLATEGYKPPVVEIAQDAYKALTSMDEEQGEKFMLSLAKGYVPGAVWVRAYKQIADAMED